MIPGHAACENLLAASTTTKLPKISSPRSLANYFKSSRTTLLLGRYALMLSLTKNGRYNRLLLSRDLNTHLLTLCLFRSHWIMCLSSEQLKKLDLEQDKSLIRSVWPVVSDSIELLSTLYSMTLPSVVPIAMTSWLPATVCAEVLNLRFLVDF